MKDRKCLLFSIDIKAYGNTSRRNYLKETIVVLHGVQVFTEEGFHCPRMFVIQQNYLNKLAE